MSEFYAFTSIFLGQISLMIGCTSFSWSSPMLPKLLDIVDNPLGRTITETEHSWLASIAMLSACCGCIIYGFFSREIGRKPLMISMGLISMIFYLIMAWATDIRLFYLCRFATGFILGASSTIVPLYTAELARPDTRGILGMWMSIFMNIGLLIPTSVGPFISMFWFHTILAIISAVFVLMMIFFSFESPHYLVDKNYDEAERILKKLRGEYYNEKELLELQMDSKRSSFVSVKEIVMSKDFLKAFVMILGLNTFNALTGIDDVTTYTETIFDMAGHNVMPSTICTIIIGVTQLISTLIMSIIADDFPRKSLLIASYLGLVVVDIILGLYFIVHDRYIDVVRNLTWLPLLCLMLIVILYNVGAGPIHFTILGEVFSAESKGVAASVTMVYNYVLMFYVAFIFDACVKIIGIGLLFVIFGIFCLIASFFVHFFVVETKGKSLIEIQHILKGN